MLESVLGAQVLALQVADDPLEPQPQLALLRVPSVGQAHSTIHSNSSEYRSRCTN